MQLEIKKGKRRTDPKLPRGKKRTDPFLPFSKQKKEETQNENARNIDNNCKYINIDITNHNVNRESYKKKI